MKPVEERRFSATSGPCDKWALIPEGHAVGPALTKQWVRSHSPSLCGRVNSISTTSNPAPITMQLSARLNTGH